MSTPGIRLNRYLAQSGFGSRRACDELIREGRVTINGRTVTDLATQVAPGDAVKVGTRLARNEVETKGTMTAMLHKPKGYLCTADDPEGRKTIYDLLPEDWPRVFYVGRLDADSEGLLVVTNDGALAQRLTHPSYKLPKTYEVTLDREFDFSMADKLRKGVLVEGKKARMEEIHALGGTSLKVVLAQGLKRQIRLMFLYLGYKVRRLIRTEIGGLKLGRLPAGRWELLSDKDIARYFPVQAPSRPPASFRAPRSYASGAPRKKTGSRTPSASASKPFSKSGSKPFSKPGSKPFGKSFPKDRPARPSKPSSGTYSRRSPRR